MHGGGQAVTGLYMKISLCIPMYNEAAIVSDTVRTVYGAMEKISSERGYDYEIIFANDGSTDRCADIVRDTAKELGCDRIRVVGYEKNRGKGAAVRCAMLDIKGDVAVCTDCDLAYGTDVIGAAAEYFDPFVRQNVPDILIGSRRLGSDGYEGYTLLRKAASRIYMAVLRIAMGFELSDSQCGFKAYTAEAASRIFSELETDGFAFDIEVLMRAADKGMTVAELPVKIVNHRESKVRVLSDSLKMMGDLIRIKRSVNRNGKE